MRETEPDRLLNDRVDPWTVEAVGITTNATAVVIAPASGASSAWPAPVDCGHVNMRGTYDRRPGSGGPGLRSREGSRLRFRKAIQVLPATWRLAGALNARPSRGKNAGVRA